MASWWIAFAVVAALGAAPATGAEVAGSVKVARGSCFAVRDGRTVPMAAGQRLYVADTLRTGADGTLGVILRDDTTLTLGPDTEVKVASFAFAPAQGRLELVLKMLKGVVSYLSGQIARLAPSSVQFQTPVATVGVRGTRFLAKVEPR